MRRRTSTLNCWSRYRLLTNLETHREKLLQILLIGQPELRDTLARSELRQLAQRVTARYHLEPLDEGATAAYVRHRLEVAGARRPLFTPAAMRALHRASGGIPRLINVLGDRALLGAFADGAAQVDAALVKRAAREVGGTLPARSGFGWAAVAVVLVAAAAVGLVSVTRESTMEPATPAVASVVPVPEPEPVGPEPAPEVEPPDLTRLFEADDDLAGATATLLQLWGATGGDGLPGRLCGIATEQGLSCVRGRGSWNNLRVLDRPALLELRADGATRTVLVTGMDGTNARLWLPSGEVAVPVLTLDPAWLGEYLLLWRPPDTPAPTLRRDMRSQTVVWLRDALQQWAGTPITPGPDPQRFDGALESAVREFQQSLGLEVDGIAGERTMVHLDGITGTSGPRLHPLEDADVPDS
jgi:general secretion pathway protein A